MRLDERQRTREVFLAALCLEPKERTAFLDRECGADGSLRNRVRSLLLHDHDASGFLERPVSPAVWNRLLSEGPLEIGDRAGAWVVTAYVGSGGMGSVYLARRDDEAFDKEAAIKVIRPTDHRLQVVELFLEERQILAQLEHPNVARLLDGGTTKGGLPYLVMEYVGGPTLVEHCDGARLSVEKRVRLFLQVCEAVRYLHRNLIVHRDLKPSNILVSADGRPRLLDFGIATLVGDRAVARTGNGPAGSLGAEATDAVALRPLTPHYASPEQLADRPVTTASDVYSLGVVLFELLVGALPRDWRRLDRETILERLDRESPNPPSRAALHRFDDQTAIPDPVERAALRGVGTPQALRRRLRGDLDAIVLRALRTDPEERYSSVEELQVDLQRYLEKGPVKARGPDARYRVGCFLRRAWLPLAALSTIIALLLILVLTSRRQSRRVEAQRAVAVAEQEKSRDILLFLVDAFAESDPNQVEDAALTAKEVLDRAVEKAAELADRPDVELELKHHLATIYRGLGQFERARGLLKEAVAGRRRLGEPDPDLGRSLAALSYVHSQAGRPQEAEPLAREALARLTAALGEDHSEVAGVRLRLASILRSMAEYDEAEDLANAALTSWQALGPESRRGVASCLHLLSQLSIHAGEYGRALEQSERALDIYRELNVRGRPYYATLDNVMRASYYLGNYPQATRAAEEILEGNRRLFGEEHHRTLQSRRNLAAMVATGGDFDRADELYREAIEAGIRILGPRHPDLARTYSNYAAMLLDLEDYRSAETMLETALGIQQGVWGRTHPEIAVTLHNMALANQGLERFERAERLVREALAINREKLGDDHPRVVSNLNLLAGVVAAAGHRERALEALQAALEANLRVSGPGHPETATAHANLAVHLRDGGRLEEAKDHLDRAIEIRRERFGDEHPELADLLEARARLLIMSGEPEGAFAELDRVDAILVESSGSFASLRREALVSRAEAWIELGKPARAEPLLRQALGDDASDALRERATRLLRRVSGAGT